LTRPYLAPGGTQVPQIIATSRFGDRAAPRGAVAGYLMSFDIFLNSSEPARPSQSKSTVSAVVIVAPAARQRSRPVARWSSRRDATPLMGTCTEKPRPHRSRTV